MSESLPPTKKSSAGLIVLGVLLLLAAGSGVFWKISQGNSASVVEETIKLPTPAATTAALNEAPPPPPSDEELAALEKKDEPATATGSKPSGPAGCSSKCGGTAGADLKTALAARGGQARGCYQRALRVNSALEGKMSVALKLSPTGAVCGASISGDTLGDAGVTSCVLQNFRSGKYPAPQGGCVDASVPLNFVSK